MSGSSWRHLRNLFHWGDEAGDRGEAPPAPEEPAPAPGSVLHGRYRLDEPLGKGAGAVVYRGRDLVLEQSVAVKVLLLDGMYQTAAARAIDADLRAEARAAMRLAHPNIVHVYNYDRDGVWEYLVMELLGGTDLGKLRSSRPSRRLGVEETVRYGIAALDALGHAHAHGVVHNDVKPGNLVLDGDGALKVCDFGLARLKGVHVDLHGVVAGSPVYMAPERIEGAAGDGRSDLYSLGATLFALMVGEPPFGKDARKAIRRHLTEPVPESPLVPSAIARVLRKAMAKGPEQRFADAAEMRAEILAAVEPLPLPLDAIADLEPRAKRPMAARRQAAEATPVVAPARPATVAPPPDLALVRERSVDMDGQSVRVGAFLMGKVPVTNEEYAAFVRATGETPPLHWLGDRPPTGRERHPVVGVTIDQARRYAAWRGRRLPTVAEWMAVVRGEVPRKFPWGNTCDHTLCQCALNKPGGTAAVDAHTGGATPEGCADLLGNVWEWAEADARVPPPADGRAFALGGSYRHGCRAPGEVPRTEVQVEKAYDYVGFRCAADLGVTR